MKYELLSLSSFSLNPWLLLWHLTILRRYTEKYNLVVEWPETEPELILCCLFYVKYLVQTRPVTPLFLSL